MCRPPARSGRAIVGGRVLGSLGLQRLDTTVVDDGYGEKRHHDPEADGHKERPCNPHAYGVAIIAWNVVEVSLGQELAPDELRGRVASVSRLFAWGTQPIGALLGGVGVWGHTDDPAALVSDTRSRIGPCRCSGRFAGVPRREEDSKTSECQLKYAGDEVVPKRAVRKWETYPRPALEPALCIPHQARISAVMCGLADSWERRSIPIDEDDLVSA